MLIKAERAISLLKGKKEEKEKEKEQSYFNIPFPSDNKWDDEYVNKRIENAIEQCCDSFYVPYTVTNYGFNCLTEAGYYIIKNYPVGKGLDFNNEIVFDRNGVLICFSEDALHNTVNKLTADNLIGWEVMTKFE